MFENLCNRTTKSHVLTVMDDQTTDVIAVLEYRPVSKMLVIKVYQKCPVETLREAVKFFEKDDYDNVAQIVYIKGTREVFELALEEAHNGK